MKILSFAQTSPDDRERFADKSAAEADMVEFSFLLASISSGSGPRSVTMYAIVPAWSLEDNEQFFMLFVYAGLVVNCTCNGSILCDVASRTGSESKGYPWIDLHIQIFDREYVVHSRWCGLAHE